MKRTDIKWCRLDNATETATLKQHGYIRKERVSTEWEQKYEGNAQLCYPRGFVSDDGESAMKFEDIDFYKLDPSKNACKRCLKIYNNIKVA